MDYDALNKAYRKAKGALTRAQNSDDPRKVIAAVTAARAAFDRDGYPDLWPRWRIAVSDLEYHDNPEIRTAARLESDAWLN
ncbi:hypothetical protein LCGC14_0288480 [marine sediment metagenome]|uniref:Uncharacterized protein n=1 Tax=marine sediment metagenome TaxID=412755 RepID=A0A0F9WEU2_9ZZZZ